MMALKEILQECILYALEREKFFEQAFFLGGTALRIIYKTQRFSEDLDFSLMKKDHDFNFSPIIKNVLKTLNNLGIEMEEGQIKNDKFVKSRALKSESVKQRLSFTQITRTKKINIKLEIDTNPPEFARFENKFLHFPNLHNVTIADLETLFAGKIHALLTRSFSKARDLYDFVWYCSQKTNINYEYLQSALNQSQVYKNIPKNPKNKIFKNWLIMQLNYKFQEEINWSNMKKEIVPYLMEKDHKAIEYWSPKLFTDLTALI